MNITVLASGLVTGDVLLNPVAYAGEMNAREIEIIHPTFKDAFYQLIIVKCHCPYIIGIHDGKFTLPPSLTDVASTLECQFVAAINSDIPQGHCDCNFSNSDDSQQLLFKSDTFKLKVAEGLNLNGLSPIPTYEALKDAYDNLAKAQQSIKHASHENEHIANTIQDKIDTLQKDNLQVSLKQEIKNRENADKAINDKLDLIMKKLNLI